MIRLTTIALLCILSVNLFAQDIPAKLNNSKTDKHVNIPGTDLWIVLPPGFKAVEGSMNFKKDDLNNITVMLGENFDKASSELTIARYERENTVVNEYKYFKLNGDPAKFFWLQDEAMHKNYLICSGNAQASFLILGKYDAKDKKAEKEMRKAILSLAKEKVK